MLFIFLLITLSSISTENLIGRLEGEWKPLWTSSKKLERKLCEVNAINNESVVSGCRCSGIVTRPFVFGLTLQESRINHKYFAEIVNNSEHILDAFSHSKCHCGIRWNKNVFLKLSNDNNILIMYESNRSFFSFKRRKPSTTVFLRLNVTKTTDEINDFIKSVNDVDFTKGTEVCSKDETGLNMDPNLSDQISNSLDQPEQVVLESVNQPATEKVTEDFNGSSEHVTVLQLLKPSTESALHHVQLDITEQYIGTTQSMMTTFITEKSKLTEIFEGHTMPDVTLEILGQTEISISAEMTEDVEMNELTESSTEVQATEYSEVIDSNAITKLNEGIETDITTEMSATKELSGTGVQVSSTANTENLETLITEKATFSEVVIINETLLVTDAIESVEATEGTKIFEVFTTEKIKTTRNTETTENVETSKGNTESALANSLLTNFEPDNRSPVTQAMDSIETTASNEYHVISEITAISMTDIEPIDGFDTTETTKTTIPVVSDNYRTTGR